MSDTTAVQNLLPCPFCGGPVRAIYREMRTAAPAAPTAQAAATVARTDDTIDAVSKALRRAWQLGQTYWKQVDSDSSKQQDKSDATQKKFEALVDETRAMLVIGT